MGDSNARAVWNGTLKEGHGEMRLGQYPQPLPFTFASRFGDAIEPNPEELIGGALAGCFSMFLGAVSEKAGFPATSISTGAVVTLGEGPTVEAIRLTTVAVIASITEEKFQELVAEAKANCPISKALRGVPVIEVHATLS